MSSFLGWCAFGMLKQTNRTPSKDFEKLISSVLFATRLPKSTIIIALEYMNQRFSSATTSVELKPTLSEHEIFNYLVVSLVLANKFNDDNTFTNKSWCGATGLQLSSVNQAEKEWLDDVKWSLSVVSFESNIITLEECWKTWVEKYSVKTPVTPSVNKTSAATPIMSPSSTFFSNNPSPTQYNYQTQAQNQNQQYNHHHHHHHQQPSSSSASYINTSMSSPIYQKEPVYAPAPTTNYHQHSQHPLSSPISGTGYDSDWSYNNGTYSNVPSSSLSSSTGAAWNYQTNYNDPAIQYVGAPMNHAHAPAHGYYNQYNAYHPTRYANPYYMATC